MYEKKFNHKICFNYDPEDFLKKSETQRLLDINETPNKFVKELEKRKDKIKEYLESGRDGYARCNIGGIRGSVGTHSDLTADIAIDRSYYEKIVSDEITFTELIGVDENDEDMPHAVKAFLVLKRSLLIYDKMIDLYSNETITKLLRLRLKGKKVEDSCNELEISETTYFGYLKESRIQADSRIKEILELYGFETK